MPRISIVIPLYNKAPHIERTINSVLLQEFKDYEIIVIDDGSTDGSGALVSRFKDARLRLITQENQGASAASNRGISEAKGALVAFLDADDIWKPEFLREIYRLHSRFPEAGAYATAYDQVTPAGGLLKWPDKNILPDGSSAGLISNYFRAALHYPVCVSAFAAPKNILEEIGGYTVGRIIFEDIDLFVRIALRYSIAYSQKHLAIYYQNASNRLMGGAVRCTEVPPISHTVREAIKSGGLTPDRADDLFEYGAIWQLAVARDCLLVGKRQTAMKMLEYTKGTRKFARQWWKLRLLAALPGNPAPRLWKMKQTLRTIFSIA